MSDQLQHEKNRIDLVFENLQAEGKKAFIPFITVGDPSTAATYAIAKELIRNGANIIELGVPYSDPSADGPVIMRADERALAKNTRLSDVFGVAKKISDEFTHGAVVLLLYYNSIFVYGADRFFLACQKNGIAGVIIADLPHEEQAVVLPTAQRYGVYIIPMVAPTSKSRANKILRDAKGFVYCVATLGVTGERDRYATDFADYFSWLNQATTLPKCLGFGISRPEQKKELDPYCDGIIVGSAIVRIIEEGEKANATDQAIAEMVGRFVKSFTEE